MTHLAFRAQGIWSPTEGPNSFPGSEAPRSKNIVQTLTPGQCPCQVPIWPLLVQVLVPPIPSMLGWSKFFLLLT